MSVKYKDYYEILGVKREDPQDKISKAFKKLARKYHPDLNPNDKTAEDKFKEINEAYEVLKDPEKRKLYDSLGPNWQQGQDFRPPPGYENVHFNFGGGGPGGMGGGAAGFSDFFEFIFGGGMGGPGGPGSGRAGFRAGGGQGFEDMFGGGGGGFGGYGGPRSRRGQDAEATLELTLEEAYRGGPKSVSLTEHVVGADGIPRPQSKTLSITIPTGVKDGQRIRLAGQGSPGMGGGQAGDLYLKVVIAPHAQFKLEENNVVHDLSLSPWEAVLGATVRVPTLDGAIDLNIPAGIGSGQKMRLKGRGLGSGGAKGDMFVRIMIKAPKALTPEEKKLWEELAGLSTFNPRAG